MTRPEPDPLTPLGVRDEKNSMRGHDTWHDGTGPFYDRWWWVINNYGAVRLQCFAGNK
jgi:hypothetical protein